MSENGEVFHFGEFRQGTFACGESVVLKIEKDRRILNARLHSGGHLISYAISKTPGMESWLPTKGYHFPDGAYAEFEGGAENLSGFVVPLQKTLDELLVKNRSIEKKELSFEEAQKQSIKAPQGKTARVITFEDFPSWGCGGTHVNNTDEIGRVIIRKIKNVQGKARVSYSVI
jgi:Ser-tRNA(Ala) deacylase AlaX